MATAGQLTLLILPRNTIFRMDNHRTPFLVKNMVFQLIGGGVIDVMAK